MRRLLSLLLLICLLPLPVAGAETVQSTFHAPGLDGAANFSVDFEPEWFLSDSTTYRHKLAQCSIGMAVSAFRDNSLGLENCGRHIYSFLTQAGFEKPSLEGYREKTGENTIGTAIAMQTLSDGGVLLAVAVSCAGYGMEWLGNFDIGSASVHGGFEIAAQQVAKRVTAYREAQGLSGDVRLWLTGFSRAAAVANRAAVLLIDSGVYNENHIFAYTFATPNNVKASMLTRPYPQIFNIVGQFDPVPTVPLTEWGYSKAGVTLRLPAQETDSDYAALHSQMNQSFSLIKAGGKYENNPEINWLVRKLCLIFLNACPDVEGYADSYQHILKEAFAAQGSALAKVETAVKDMLASPEVLKGLRQESAVLWKLLSQELYSQTLALLGLEASSWGSISHVVRKVVQEHYPQVYLAWMLSEDDPDRLFTQQRAYRQVALSGKGTLVWTAEDQTTGTLATLKESREGQVCATLVGNTTLFTIPADQNYTLTFTPAAEQTVEAQINELQAGLLRHRTITYAPLHMAAGEAVTLRLPAGLSDSVAAYQGQAAIEPLTIAGELDNSLETLGGLALSGGLADSFLTWLLAAVGVFVLLGLLGAVLGVRHHNRKKRLAKHSSGQ